jgi:steroid delta-isomerase-like uncharacterized protein
MARPPVLDRMLELWNGGDVELADEVYAPECIGADGKTFGPDEVRAEVQRLRDAFPDQRFEVERELATGRETVLCLRWHGTHRGAYESPVGTIEPTERPFSVRGIEIFEVRDDRITGVRLTWDLAGLLSQLGVRLLDAQTGASDAPDEF